MMIMIDEWMLVVSGGQTLPDPTAMNGEPIDSL